MLSDSDPVVVPPNPSPKPWSGPVWADCGPTERAAAGYVRFALTMCAIVMLVQHLSCSKKLLRKLPPRATFAPRAVALALGIANTVLDLQGIFCAARNHHLVCNFVATLVLTSLALFVDIVHSMKEIRFVDPIPVLSWRDYVYRAPLVWVVPTTPDSSVGTDHGDRQD
jgi:hypothetical protein